MYVRYRQVEIIPLDPAYIAVWAQLTVVRLFVKRYSRRERRPNKKNKNRKEQQTPEKTPNYVRCRMYFLRKLQPVYLIYCIIQYSYVCRIRSGLVILKLRRLPFREYNSTFDIRHVQQAPLLLLLTISRHHRALEKRSGLLCLKLIVIKLQARNQKHEWLQISGKKNTLKQQPQDSSSIVVITDHSGHQHEEERNDRSLGRHGCSGIKRLLHSVVSTVAGYSACI